MKQVDDSAAQNDETGMSRALISRDGKRPVSQVETAGYRIPEVVEKRAVGEKGHAPSLARILPRRASWDAIGECTRTGIGRNARGMEH